jgi:hypothetical protein
MLSHPSVNKPLLLNNGGFYPLIAGLLPIPAKREPLLSWNFPILPKVFPAHPEFTTTRKTDKSP